MRSGGRHRHRLRNRDGGETIAQKRSSTVGRPPRGGTGPKVIEKQSSASGPHRGIERDWRRHDAGPSARANLLSAVPVSRIEALHGFSSLFVTGDPFHSPRMGHQSPAFP
jgi:hypothetical protein